MSLLPDELRDKIPRLHSQEAETDPWIYARFAIGSRAWYVIEGEPEGDDFVFYGWIANRNGFGMFRLTELESIRGLFDSRVELDLSFIPGKLTDVVPPPDD